MRRLGHGLGRMSRPVKGRREESHADAGVLCSRVGTLREFRYGRLRGNSLRVPLREFDALLGTLGEFRDAISVVPIHPWLTGR